MAINLLKPIVPVKKRDMNIFKLSSYVATMRKRYPQFQENPNAENSHIKYYTLNRPIDDLPIICSTKEQMYNAMRDACRTMSGANFVLGMDMGGEYHVWKRQEQPCQGGEMRKYGCTHDDSTRPEDPRPGDLKHPFPDGKPLAVGIHAGSGRLKNRAFIFHEDSPYGRAFGGKPETVEFVERAPHGVVGYIMKDADLVEPTMFVTLAKDMRSGHGGSSLDVFSKWQDYLTIPEMFMLKLYAGITPDAYFQPTHQKSSNYEGAHGYIDIAAYLKGGVGASQDLSGGVLGNRYDYNRPQLMSVFRSPTPKAELYVPCFLSDVLFKRLKMNTSGVSFTSTFVKERIEDIRYAMAEELLKQKVA